jgi:putative Holliday junction resolvase
MGNVLALDGLTDRPGVLLGLDLGARRIGVAVTDARRTLAAPLAVLKRTKFTQDAAALLKFAREREAVAIVIGLPLDMDGSEGPRAQSARAFARHLAPLTDLPIAFADERLSSFAAAETMKAHGASRRTREAMIDAAAAADILETALAKMARTR